jgi:membrane protein
MAFGKAAAQGYVLDQIRALVGVQAGQAIETMIARSSQPGTGSLAAVLGVITLLVGAAGVVGQLQDALNTIWEVAPRPGRGVIGFIKERCLSLVMVLGFGFLLLVSLILSTVLTAVGTFGVGLMPAAAPAMEAAHFLLSVGVIALMIAMIFKLLPDAEVAWNDVWIGAAFTALLVTVGKSLLGLYLGRSGVTSTYGAAGSFVALLVWIYYSAQIVFFGAELTKAYANRFGSRIVPSKDAVPLTDEARAQQGMPRTEAGLPRVRSV